MWHASEFLGKYLDHADDIDGLISQEPNPNGFRTVRMITYQPYHLRTINFINAITHLTAKILGGKGGSLAVL